MICESHLSLLDVSSGIDLAHKTTQRFALVPLVVEVYRFQSICYFEIMGEGLGLEVFNVQIHITFLFQIDFAELEREELGPQRSGWGLHKSIFLPNSGHFP